MGQTYNGLVIYNSNCVNIFLDLYHLQPKRNKMKTLKNLNTFALLLPTAILITYPVFKDGSLFWAAISTILTGFIQVLIGFYFWSQNVKNIYIITYLIAVILFFTTWFYNSIIGYNDIITKVLLGIPPLLAIYLSVIIYTKKK